MIHFIQVNCYCTNTFEIVAHGKYFVYTCNVYSPLYETYTVICQPPSFTAICFMPGLTGPVYWQSSTTLAVTDFYYRRHLRNISNVSNGLNVLNIIMSDRLENPKSDVNTARSGMYRGRCISVRDNLLIIDNVVIRDFSTETFADVPAPIDYPPVVNVGRRANTIR